MILVNVNRLRNLDFFDLNKIKLSLFRYFANKRVDFYNQCEAQELITKTFLLLSKKLENDAHSLEVRIMALSTKKQDHGRN